MFPGQAEKRLQEATDYFNKQMEKLGITLDEDEVRKAIEAAVLELNKSLKDTNTQKNTTIDVKDGTTVQIG